MNEELKTKSKYVPVSKSMVWAAYKKVKRNRGSAGVDEINFKEFDKVYQKQLYKIWNRLASGSYFPPPVKEVEIPKEKGKVRKLGIPTIGDRIAQMVVKDCFEAKLEKVFHENSYGYRPQRNAHQAISKVRENCWQYNWVIDLDIKGFFDNIDHALLMKAVERHTNEKWVKMYIQRWLEAPIEKIDGILIEKQGKGTPQGGVISPLLANLFLHYSLDIWLNQNYPQNSFVRYADDVIIHCITKAEAMELLSQMKIRLNQCKLELNEEKTRIVYCKDYKRKNNYDNVSFNFLGFTFKPRPTISRIDGKPFLGFDCAISGKSFRRILSELRKLKIHKASILEIEDIASILNPKIRGWINYYSKFRGIELHKLFRKLTFRLMKWVRNKYKIIGSRSAYNWLRSKYNSNPNLFAHWKAGYIYI